MKKETFDIHPWIDKYPVSKHDQAIIIGTHPPKSYEGCLNFFYGKSCQFWIYLEKIYKEHNFRNKEGDISREQIVKWLKKYSIGITDMVYITQKNNLFGTDNKMILDTDKNINQLNTKLQEWLTNGKSNTLYFTSFTGKNNAFNLFKKQYNKEFTSKIQNSKVFIENGGKTTVHAFNRKINLILLYSPSPRANIGISNATSYKKWKEISSNKNKSIDDFRIAWYKKLLPKKTL